jgi:uncharacterized membrane protein (UPF0136 family)
MARFPIALPGLPRCTRFCSAPPAVELAPANATAGQPRAVGLRMRYQTNMDATKLYFLIFGALTIVGGIIGYVKAGSLPSIIAGAITGVLLLIAGSLLSSHRLIGLATAFVVSLLLAVQFVPKFIRTAKVMPAGLMSILSVIGLIVAVVAWLKK